MSYVLACLACVVFLNIMYWTADGPDLLYIKVLLVVGCYVIRTVAFCV